MTVMNWITLLLLSAVFWICISCQLWMTAAVAVAVANLYLLAWFGIWMVETHGESCGESRGGGDE